MPTLKVFVNEATNLFGADLDGSSDPYCVVKIGEGSQFSSIEKTRRIKNTKNPTWKECFTLNVNNPLTESLFIEVWNKESSNRDDSLGYTQLPLNDLQRGVEKQVWVQLEGGSQGSNIIGAIASHLGKKKEKVNQGKVFLGLTALDFGLDPSMQQQQFGQGMQQGQQQGMQGQQGMYGQQGTQPGIQGQQSNIGQQGMQGQQQPGLQQQQHGLGHEHSGSSYQPGMQQPGMQQGQSNIGQQGGQYPQQQYSAYPPSSGGVPSSGVVNAPQTTTPVTSSTVPPIDPSSQQYKQQQQHGSSYPQDL